MPLHSPKPLRSTTPLLALLASAPAKAGRCLRPTYLINLKTQSLQTHPRWMMKDDEWWWTMNDDEWWWMMINDDEWWWWMMLIVDELWWWIMMMMNHDDDAWWCMMIHDDVSWWIMMNFSHNMVIITATILLYCFVILIQSLLNN